MHAIAQQVARDVWPDSGSEDSGAEGSGERSARVCLRLAGCLHVASVAQMRVRLSPAYLMRLGKATHAFPVPLHTPQVCRPSSTPNPTRDRSQPQQHRTRWQRSSFRQGTRADLKL